MNLSQEEKIQVCVDMAEALYQFHGYSPAFDKYDVSRIKMIGSPISPWKRNVVFQISFLNLALP